MLRRARADILVSYLPVGSFEASRYYAQQAIEAGCGFGVWLHGEAVAAGTVIALELSRRLGWLDPADVERVKSVFARACLPLRGPALDADRYLEFMGHDKKARDGKLRLVLLKRLGEAVTTSDAPLAEIRAAIEACCG